MKTQATQFRNKTIVEATLPSHLDEWFAEDIEVLWIPIFDMPQGVDAVQHIDHMQKLYGDYRILRGFDDVAQLPVGIRGWIVPATADDSEVICIRHENGDIEYLGMVHPKTGECMSYQSTRAYDLK